MSYILKEVTIKTDNSAEGIEKINQLWRDIQNGKLPIIFDSEKTFNIGISPISKYSNYSSDEKGEYDLTIIGVQASFFKEMAKEVEKGTYEKYEEVDEQGDIEACTKRAWERVWADTSSGKIKRSFTSDYESTVPSDYTKDGKAHCYLYIAVKKA